MSNFRKKLGERIKKMREKIGLSQEKLAKKVKINRVSLSQVENGQRDVSATEVTKFSKIFNISTDVLLDLKQDIKVELELIKTTMLSNKKTNKPDVRIKVPQENIEKFKEVLLYILNKVGSKSNVGETVLYKLLYFIDFDYYEKYEEQLIGAVYQKNNYGPTPVEFTKIVQEMEGDDLVKVSEQYFQYPQTKYLPKRKPDLNKLKSNEVELIDEVLNRLSDMNANKISEHSHNDVPWLTTENGELIDYETVFYRTPAYSVRNYDDDTATDIQ